MNRKTIMVLAGICLLASVWLSPIGGVIREKLSGSEMTEIDNLCVDDHVDMKGKIVRIIDSGKASDSNVVTLIGDTLVAADVGSALISVDGKLHIIEVGKAKINIIMIMGQSNAGNHFKNSTSDVTCQPGTAYWWGDNKGASATGPVPYTGPSMGFHSPLLAELYAQSEAAEAPVKNVMVWEEGITSKTESPSQNGPKARPIPVELTLQ